MTFSVVDLAWQAPILILAATGLFLVVAESFASGTSRKFMMNLAVAGCVIAAVVAVLAWRKLGGQPRSLMGGMLVADTFGMFMIILFSVITALTALSSADYMHEHEFEAGEYYAVLLLSATGMGMLAMAGDLVTVFIGIEIMSIGAYVLIASRRRSKRSAEAAMKYFLMGAFATAFLLYGIALVYGAIGSTDLGIIGARVSAFSSDPLLITGILFMIIAFGFKVAAFPFHMWTPDAYEGAPTPITGFMASGVKAAAFAGMVRVLADTFGGDVLPYGYMGWAGLIAATAAITMTIGNVAALRQENVKRMLAYSSIAHAGTMLVAVAAIAEVDEEGVRSPERRGKALDIVGFSSPRLEHRADGPVSVHRDDANVAAGAVTGPAAEHRGHIGRDGQRDVGSRREQFDAVGAAKDAHGQRGHNAATIAFEPDCELEAPRGCVGRRCVGFRTRVSAAEDDRSSAGRHEKRIPTAHGHVVGFGMTRSAEG